MAEQHGRDYVNLAEVVIPPNVVELVPESVARENAVIPLAEGDGKLKVIVSDPNDFETIDKLVFILNRQIEIALAPRESILEAINRYYGQTVGESADSMLQEFTDTAIDFAEEETGGGREDIDEASAPIVRLVHLLISEMAEGHGRHDFKPIERLALLNGLLGYFFAVIYLQVDLGQPWRLVYPMFVSLGPAAVLFLVAWHVEDPGFKKYVQEWERRSAVIQNERGEVIFEQRDVAAQTGDEEQPFDVAALGGLDH